MTVWTRARTPRIFDTRVRPPCKSFLDLHVYTRDPHAPGTGRADVAPATSVVTKSFSRFLEEANACRLSAALVVGRRARSPFGSVSNDDVLDAVATKPDLLLACPSLSLSDPGAAIDEVSRLGPYPAVRAFSIEPGWHAPPLDLSDRSLYPVFEIIEAFGLPLLVGIGGHLGDKIDDLRPHALATILRDLPNLTVVLCHGGWPFVDEAIALAFNYTNLYLSPDMYLNAPSLPFSHEYVAAANSFMQERMLYGSAYPARPLGDGVSRFVQLPLRESVKSQVLYDNAARLFGPPAASHDGGDMGGVVPVAVDQGMPPDDWSLAR